jgi:hypothetical protein
VAARRQDLEGMAMNVARNRAAYLQNMNMELHFLSEQNKLMISSL